jgi:hypothetical protein
MEVIDLKLNNMLSTIRRISIQKSASMDNRMEILLNSKKNVFQIRNNTNADLYVNIRGVVDTSNYEIKITAGITRIYTIPEAVTELYLYGAGVGEIIINSYYAYELYPADLDETTLAEITTIVAGQVSLSQAIPAGNNVIGQVKITDGTNEMEVESDGSINVNTGLTEIEITDGNNTLEVENDGSINVNTGLDLTTLENLLTNTPKSVGDSFTRPNDTTPYDALDVVGDNSNLLFEDIADGQGVIKIEKVSLKIGVNAIPSGMSGFYLHFYNSAPTAINDNAPFNLPSADSAKYLGYVYINSPEDLGDTLYSEVNPEKLLEVTGTDVYAILTTAGAFTPSALVVKSIGIVAKKY